MTEKLQELVEKLKGVSAEQIEHIFKLKYGPLYRRYEKLCNAAKCVIDIFPSSKKDQAQIMLIAHQLMPIAGIAESDLEVDWFLYQIWLTKKANIVFEEFLDFSDYFENGEAIQKMSIEAYESDRNIIQEFILNSKDK